MNLKEAEKIINIENEKKISKNLYMRTYRKQKNNYKNKNNLENTNTNTNIEKISNVKLPKVFLKKFCSFLISCKPFVNMPPNFPVK